MIRRTTLAAYLFLLLANVLYFYTFVYTRPITQLTADVNSLFYYFYFFFPVNYDYLMYEHIFRVIDSGSWQYWSNSNFAISFFYVYASRLTHLSYDVVSFIVNNLLIVGSYYYLVRILEAAGLSTRYSFLFFLNPQLVYYSQAINKEMPALYFVLQLTYLVSKRRWLMFGAVAVLAGVLRQQLLLFAGFLYFLQTARRFRARLMVAYVASAVLAVIAPSIGLRSASTVANARFSKFVFDLNDRFYVGSLLLAPVTVAQWIYEQMRSLWFITDEGYVNLYYLRDVIPIVLLLCLLPANLQILLRIRVYGQRPQRLMLSAILAFTFMQLIHPIIQQRYYFPLVVLLLAMGFGVLGSRVDVARSRGRNAVTSSDIRFPETTVLGPSPVASS